MSEEAKFKRKLELSPEKEISDTKKLKSQAETNEKSPDLDN